MPRARPDDSTGNLFAADDEPAWSHLQRAIFDEVTLGTGNIAVCARAGCAKTSSSVEAIKRILQQGSPVSVMTLAYNKSIQKELASRLPQRVEVATTHGLGLKALRKAKTSVLDKDRLKNVVAERFSDTAAAVPWKNAVMKMVARAKSTLPQTREEFLDLIPACSILLRDLVPLGRRNIALTATEQRDIARALIEHVQDVLAHCRSHPEVHDFDDMIWLPMVNQWPVGEWDWVVVDEAQDLSRVQVELIAASMGPHSRLLAVGDPAQAIYRFRGADSRAFARIVERFECKVMPLSITYRCPKKVVRLAQRAVSDFQADESAPEGVIHEIASLDVGKLRPGDFVLSRKNAPLVRLAIRCIAAGTPAAIAGRDLAKTLLKRLEAVVRQVGPDREVVRASIDRTYIEMIQAAAAQDLDAQDMIDERDAIFALLDSQRSTSDALLVIDRICQEDPANVVLFSSVHRAKGLERNNVYVLRSTFRTELAFQSIADTGPILYTKDISGERFDSEEEDNLWYVAITRTKKVLTLVANDD